MIDAVFFDLYGTLIDIETNEWDSNVFRILSNYLKYEGIDIRADRLKETYYDNLKIQISTSNEKYADVNIVEAFRSTIEHFGFKCFGYILSIVAKLFRSSSIVYFNLFPETKDILNSLSRDYKLGLISDAQDAFIKPELSITGLDNFFDSIIYSSLLGFKKPDKRMFKIGLASLNVRPKRSVYIGDSAKRDVGAKKSGMIFILLKRGESKNIVEETNADYIANDLIEAEKIIRSL